MNPPLEDVADSRSNVVGRKRVLHTSSEQDREVIAIDSSSDESAKQPRKRARQNIEISSTESVKVEVDLTSSPLAEKSAGIVKPGASIGQPVAWNQGVQTGLRTSFQSKKPSSPQNTSFESALTKKQLSKLPEKKQLEVMKAHTQDINNLINLHGWPLPKDLQQSCMKHIEDGLTFYPVPIKKGHPLGLYSFGGGDVQLRELHDAEGKPIMLEHITYPDVIRALVANNEGLKQVLTDKRAKSAFKAFLVCFYRHVPQKDLFVSSLLEKAPLLKSIFKNSGPFSALTKNFDKTSPPELARAVDHYTNAPQAIIDNGLVEDEAPVEENNTSASNSFQSTTESNGKMSTRIAPTLATNAIDPARDLTGADTVQMDHGSSDSVMGGDELHSDGGFSGEIDHGRDVETSRESGSIQELTPEDRAAILKYFPNTDGVILRRCLICGSSGHERAGCPDSLCSSCGSKGDHLTPACPRTVVCDKCRGVGHQTLDCPEKLRAAKEDIKCVICQSSSHHESQCHFIWRSFLPGPDEIKKVRNISVYCYFCGGSGHFGPDCGLHRDVPASGGITWSRNNMEKYLEGPSSYDAMSLGGNDYSIPNRAKKGFSIKGKANDPIDLDDSDYDDEGLIHPKVNMGPKNGKIQFSQAGSIQSFNQGPFQFQGNSGGNQHSRTPSRNQGGGGGGGEKKKPRHKSGNPTTRGGGSGRGRGGRGRGGGGGGGGHKPIRGSSTRGGPGGRR
ncbi:hypothetical protein NHQ30_007181 [Ciborinia camelliae]|nr:hypothetical protein NHQ30_007181 [Ciborinia camelliae]